MKFLENCARFVGAVFVDEVSRRLGNPPDQDKLDEGSRIVGPRADATPIRS